jgi:hypothetical protein
MPVIDIGGKKVHAEVVMNPYVNVAHVLWENDIKCWNRNLDYKISTSCVSHEIND